MERGERNREAAPELVIMLIRMICGEPQTDEEQQGEDEEEEEEEYEQGEKKGKRG